MDDTLRTAGQKFLEASQARDEHAGPLDESSVAGAESYIGRPLPAVWREFVLSFGTGPRRIRFAWPDASGMFHLGLGDANEHQAETDDGIAIAQAGGYVLGYIEGIGDCVILDADGRVQHHSHGGSDTALGTLAEFVDELTKRLKSGDDVIER